MRNAAVLALSLIALTACKTEVDGKPAAEVKEVEAPASSAPTPEAAAAPALPADGVKVDKASSSIGFVGAKVTGQHDGGFKDFDGAVVLNDAGEPTDVVFVVDMNSTWADADKLTKHLKDGDFFDVATYPESSFDATSITKGEDGKYTVVGILDLRGQKKELTFPADIVVADDKVTMDAEFTMNRKVWGIAYAGKPDDLIKDEVLLKLDFDFPRS
ncbi:MAG: YceI family protein [Myxococcota bacterium]|nr:YceI family protein [Myxococcota bacterium]